MNDKKQENKGEEGRQFVLFNTPMHCVDRCSLADENIFNYYYYYYTKIASFD